MNHYTAMQERIGVSKLDLLLFKFLHLITFKKFLWIEIQISKIAEDLEIVKNRRVF